MKHKRLRRALPTPRLLGAVLLSIPLIVLQVPTANAAGTGGVPVLRTFEDLPVGAPVYNSYDGVTFPEEAPLITPSLSPILQLQPPRHLRHCKLSYSPVNSPVPN